MKLPSTCVLFLIALPMAPLLAQTTIGGGSCTSSSLNGTYALSLTGRQVTASGTYTGVFQSNGSAKFDGQNTVNITLVANTGTSASAPLTWSGTYSVQANCAGLITITSGGTATLNMVLYDSGVDFLLSGSDATYTYSGTGNTEPTTACSAATFSGVYTYNATGFALTSGAVSGVRDAAGLMQFDGVSAITVNLTMVTGTTAPSPLALSGSYSISSTCLGSATLIDASGNSYVMTFSVYNNTVANAAAYVSLAQSSKLIVEGSVHTAFGQTAAGASARPPAGESALSMIAQGGRA